jgi:hypothetical protein
MVMRAATSTGQERIPEYVESGLRRIADNDDLRAAFARLERFGRGRNEPGTVRPWPLPVRLPGGQRTPEDARNQPPRHPAAAIHPTLAGCGPEHDYGTRTDRLIQRMLSQLSGFCVPSNSFA